MVHPASDDFVGLKDSTKKLVAGLKEATQASPAPQFQRTKVKYCVFFLQGVCKHGKGCNFAHSPDEIQPAKRQTKKVKQTAAVEKGNGDSQLVVQSMQSFPPVIKPPGLSTTPDESHGAEDDFVSAVVDTPRRDPVAATLIKMAPPPSQLPSPALARFSAVEGHHKLGKTLDLAISSGVDLADMLTKDPELQRAAILHLLQAHTTGQPALPIQASSPMPATPILGQSRKAPPGQFSYADGFPGGYHRQQCAGG